MKNNPHSLEELIFHKSNSHNFKDFIMTCGTYSKWFLWHLNNELSDYAISEIISKSQQIGVVCISKEHYADLIIHNEFKHRGFGTWAISLLKQMSSKIKFKVNVHNKESVRFFDSLIAKEILFRKDSSEKFHIYQ